jgi:ribosome-associated protein
VTVIVFDGSTTDRSRSAPVLDMADVRVDAFRSSGAGGQHRNKVSSAIRMTHLPSGIVVTATEERSQHQNRAVAQQRLLDALTARRRGSEHQAVNDERLDALGEFRTWTWTGWRDEVKGPDGIKASMSRALGGRLDPLLR